MAGNTAQAIMKVAGCICPWNWTNLSNKVKLTANVQTKDQNTSKHFFPRIKLPFFGGVKIKKRSFLFLCVLDPYNRLVVHWRWFIDWSVGFFSYFFLFLFLFKLLQGTVNKGADWFRANSRIESNRTIPQRWNMLPWAQPTLLLKITWIILMLKKSKNKADCHFLKKGQKV